MTELYTDYCPLGLIFPEASTDTLEDPGPMPSSGDRESSTDSCQNRTAWLGRDGKGKKRGGMPAIGPHPSGLPPSTSEWSLDWERRRPEVVVKGRPKAGLVLAPPSLP